MQRVRAGSNFKHMPCIAHLPLRWPNRTAEFFEECPAAAIMRLLGCANDEAAGLAGHTSLVRELALLVVFRLIIAWFSWIRNLVAV
jgi:hypothetical protein